MRQIEHDAEAAADIVSPFTEHELDVHPDRDKILSTFWWLLGGGGSRFLAPRPVHKEPSNQQG